LVKAFNEFLVDTCSHI